MASADNGNSRIQRARDDLESLIPAGEAIPGCPSCGEVIPQMQAQVEMVEYLQRQLMVKGMQLSKLRGAHQLDAQQHPMYKVAKEVWDYWRPRLAPRAREFSEKQRRAVIARLTTGDPPYTVDELKTAVDGYMGHQYVVDGKRVRKGSKDCRYIDLELICRDDKHVRDGLGWAEEDAGFDKELLSFGAKPWMVRLCDCGHPFIHHMPAHLHPAKVGLTPCCEDNCECMLFETTEEDEKEWRAIQTARELHAQERAARQAKAWSEGKGPPPKIPPQVKK